MTLAVVALFADGVSRIRNVGHIRHKESDRIAALERVVSHLRELRRLRALQACLVVPAVDPAARRAVFVAGGRVCSVRTLPVGPGARLEVEAGLRAARPDEKPSLEPDTADELLLVGSFLRRPPPELAVCPLEPGAILLAASGRRAA
jgi:hypothetical protein